MKEEKIWVTLEKAFDMNGYERALEVNMTDIILFAKKEDAIRYIKNSLNWNIQNYQGSEVEHHIGYIESWSTIYKYNDKKVKLMFVLQERPIC